MRTKFRGGYNIKLAGRPDAQMTSMAEPTVLRIPLRTQRFHFSKLLVKDGERVKAGTTLALATEQFDIPLLAPRTGNVRLRSLRGCITLDELAKDAPRACFLPLSDSDIDPRWQELIGFGVWPFLFDAFNDKVLSPLLPASAAIVSTVQLEPFLARGDLQISKFKEEFLRGLDLLPTLVDAPVYVVIPNIKSPLRDDLKKELSHRSDITVVDVPYSYPFDNYRVLAQSLGLKKTKEKTIWGLQTEGVLAIDKALTLRQPVTERLVAVGGSGIQKPSHLIAPFGCPIEDILQGRLADKTVRLIEGGILNGKRIIDTGFGLDLETSGLTALIETQERELLGFLKPGFDRISYSNCFLSFFRGCYQEALTTAVRGEKRPCVGCGFCEEVCPVGIMPHLIHKLAYCDSLEEIEQCGSATCVGCGLCTYVCPSKLDLRTEILQVNQVIQRDLHPEQDKGDNAKQDSTEVSV